MGFFEKLVNAALNAGMGEQAKIDPVNQAYADQQGWTYVHSEMSMGITLIKDKGLKDGLSSFSGQDPDVPPTNLPLHRTRLEPFTNGHSASRVGGREIFRGTHNEREFSAGTFYWKKRDSGDDDSPDIEYRCGVITFEYDTSFSLPPIQVSPETGGTRLAGRLFGDLDVESELFNQTWQVLVHKDYRNTAITLLHPRMQETLMELAETGIKIGFEGPYVVICTPRYRVKEKHDFLSGKIALGSHKHTLDSTAVVVDDYMLDKESIHSWLAVAEQVGAMVPSILRTTQVGVEEVAKHDTPKRPTRPTRPTQPKPPNFPQQP